MSNIHQFPSSAPAAARKPRRGPYKKKATKAEIERAIRTAKELGLTVYGVTILGEQVHVQTQPSSNSDSHVASPVDAWFDRHG